MTKKSTLDRIFMTFLKATVIFLPALSRKLSQPRSKSSIRIHDNRCSGIAALSLFIALN